jgi:parallel beta-helix repeat protein
MNKKILLPFLVMALCVAIKAQIPKRVVAESAIKKGMVITQNTKIKKAVYKLDASQNLDQPVILIEGLQITVDFNNATLQGSNSNPSAGKQEKNPDEFFGVAIIISSRSTHVTIKNLKVKGYKVALLAKGVTSLTLENCDFSYNYRRHLNSTQQKEDISDWLSYHHNENDEWLRYGAAIYLRNCNMPIIRNCRVTGGQNALLMTNCNDGLIVNNDFSFNSGVGIGMYRCSYNDIAYNKIDFNVRGYSDSVYNRGQDSAGILVYEQSSNNLFYKNSVTHSGDGFFLWAGQTTMNTGKGGCNDNIIFGNDFSYAPTNGVEVTFSRNKILKNRMFECDNGIWGGYSYHTEIANNQFRNNNVAIAIEQGQDNAIHHNLFFRDKTAIKLWAKKEQPADTTSAGWGYVKYRDTRSRNYILLQNSYNENKTALDITRTDSLEIFGDYISNVDQYLKTDSTVTNVDTIENADLVYKFSVDSVITGPAIDNPIDPFKGMGKFAGRKNILITEWGPYDFRSPVIWNTNPTDTSDIMQFDIKGPAGKWKIKSYKGVDSLSARSGTIPTTITAKKLKGERTDINIQLEYTGEQITTPFGKAIPKGIPYVFSFKKFFQPVDWRVTWYSLDTSLYNPLKTGQLFAPNIRIRPIKTEKTQKLDYAWWGGIKTDEGIVPQFITVAEGSGNFEKGKYKIGITWDDAVRIYVDDSLLVNEWDPSKYDFNESPHRAVEINLDEGVHHFHIEHIELGGFAALELKIKKA